MGQRFWAFVTAAVAWNNFGSVGEVQGRAPAKPPNWVYSFEAGKAAAARTGQPIFLVFRCQP